MDDNPVLKVIYCISSYSRSKPTGRKDAVTSSDVLCDGFIEAEGKGPKKKSVSCERVI